MKWTFLPATRFPEQAARWGALNAASVNSPLLHPDFIGPLITHFGTGQELLAIGELDGQTAAMGVVGPTRRGSWSTFQPSQAPLSAWLQLPTLDQGAVLDGLMRALPGFPLMFSLTQRDPQLDPRPGDQQRVRTLDYIDTARITVAGSFEDYWAKRGKNLRTNLKKQRNRLEREAIVTTYEEVRAPERMAQAVADYGALEGKSWKARGGTAITATNAQGQFYATMLAAFARRGAAAVLYYRFNGEVVAMNMCIDGGGTIVVLKTTYDESVPSHYSPAFLLHEESCQRLWTEGRYHSMEFYGRVMDWHLRWTDEVRTMYHVNNYRWAGLLGLHTLAKRGLARLRPAAPAPAAPAAPSTTEQA